MNTNLLTYLLTCFFVFTCSRSVCNSENAGSINWYSPSRRPLRRQAESPFNNRYDDYDYACAYGDRLPAPSPVYSRHGYVQRNQCDWYARGDGDGHFEPDRLQDNALQAPDGRSPYRQYDESVNRSRDRTCTCADDKRLCQERWCDDRCGESGRWYEDFVNRSRDERYDSNEALTSKYDESVNRSRDLSDNRRLYDPLNGDQRKKTEGLSYVSYKDDNEEVENRSSDPLDFDEDLDVLDSQRNDHHYGRRRLESYEGKGDFENRSRDLLGCYYDEGGRFLDGGTFSYAATTASRLPDGQTRRNGGIGYDWTSAAPDRKSADRKLADRKSPNLKTAYRKSSDRELIDRKSPNRKSPDRKSAYQDDSVLIIGASENYLGGDRAPFDYNAGTVQRRGGKTSTSYPDDLRSVDGMERRLPVGTESVSESPYRKEKDRMQRESPHRGGTSPAAVAATAKTGSQARGRTKVDDIQRLTERDRAPPAQNRKQQNHVTPRAPSPRVDESAKQSRSRGHKSLTSPASTTSGNYFFNPGLL